MSYEFYKVLHLFGFALTLSGLIGLVANAWTSSVMTSKQRKIWMIAHGVGLVIILVSGFGLAARLNYMAQLPVWVYAKLAIWFAAGAMATLIKRLQVYAKWWYLVTLALFTVAAFVAVTKPWI